jgi:hypothetical protein
VAVICGVGCDASLTSMTSLGRSEVRRRGWSLVCLLLAAILMFLVAERRSRAAPVDAGVGERPIAVGDAFAPATTATETPPVRGVEPVATPVLGRRP